MLSTWLSISDLLVYCGVWALQARRLHKGIWCWAPVILWWITGMNWTGTMDGFESGRYSRAFIFPLCCQNPLISTLKPNLGVSPQVTDLLAAMIWSWLWDLEIEIELQIHRSPNQRGLLNLGLNCALGYRQTHARKCGCSHTLCWSPYLKMVRVKYSFWSWLLSSMCK